ncbi:MAG: restriction endonuclease [Pseudorhodobacter sp.]|nr:restriction endonuclease [Pseudorhodobacter sp.]
MAHAPTIWGVHMGRQAGDIPISKGYVAIGWRQLGDLRSLPRDREAIKQMVVARIPEAKAGAVPVYAGTVFKFVHEIRPGDVVVYPSKADRVVNIGVFTGRSDYVPDSPDSYPNRRYVEWRGHFSRDVFSQDALNEIGSAVTLFQVRRHARKFMARIFPDAPDTNENKDHISEVIDDDASVSGVARLAQLSAEDFIIRSLMRQLDGFEFEKLVAHLLECMGYTARVTPKTGDGGVDVIAHTDPLGFQPPIIKVQCKRITDQTSRPDVDRLLGTLGDGEFGLFINLDSFARGAYELERNRPKLRLVNGAAFVEIFLKNYEKLSPKYRSMIPLKQIYVPDLAESE